MSFQSETTGASPRGGGYTLQHQLVLVQGG